jgi:hypothetical protein
VVLLGLEPLEVPEIPQDLVVRAGKALGYLEHLYNLDIL